MPKKGETMSAEQRAKIAASRTGQKHAPETREKIGAGVARRKMRKRALDPKVVAGGLYGPVYLKIGPFRVRLNLNDLPDDPS